jgi:hypothetical protein
MKKEEFSLTSEEMKINPFADAFVPKPSPPPIPEGYFERRKSMVVKSTITPPQIPSNYQRRATLIPSKTEVLLVSSSSAASSSSVSSVPKSRVGSLTKDLEGKLGLFSPVIKKSAVLPKKSNPVVNAFSSASQSSTASDVTSSAVDYSSTGSMTARKQAISVLFGGKDNQPSTKKSGSTAVITNTK